MKNTLFALTLAAAFAAPAVLAQSAFPDQPVNVTAAARHAAAGPFVPRSSTGYTVLTPRNIPVPPTNTIVSGDTTASIDSNGTVHRRQVASVKSKSKPRSY